MEKNKFSKILGLDMGTHRIGVAITDENQSIVFPRETITYTKFESVLVQLSVICQESGVGEIVIGLPIDEEGRERKITRFVRSRAEKISQKLGLPVHFVDESFSTQEGFSQMVKPQIEYRDMMSAVVILKRYLEIR